MYSGLCIVFCVTVTADAGDAYAFVDGMCCS